MATFAWCSFAITELQTALILSVTFIWSYPWVGLKALWYMIAFGFPSLYPPPRRQHFREKIFRCPFHSKRAPPLTFWCFLRPCMAENAGTRGQGIAFPNSEVQILTFSRGSMPPNPPRLQVIHILYLPHFRVLYSIPACFRFWCSYTFFVSKPARFSVGNIKT
jgi:hypothetical protein